MKNPKRLFCVVLTFVLLLSSITVGAAAESNLMYGIGFVKADSLRLRQEPSTGSKVTASAAANECVVVISKEGDWYHVIYNLKQGYMHKDYLTVLTAENAELGYGKVTGSGVNLRKGPGVGYEITASASKGDQCYILGLNQGWYKVIYQDKICYVRSDYLELTEIPYENKASQTAPRFYRGGKSLGVTPNTSALAKPTESSSPSAQPNVTGTQIVAKAQQYLGTPYVSGGASPNGFDCSGFVYYVLKSFGISISRTPAGQFSIGSNVEQGNLQPGDIVFFAGTAASGISHVGIYTGSGQFIHAPNSRSVVSYSDLTTGYWAQHYYGARRVQ